MKMKIMSVAGAAVPDLLAEVLADLVVEGGFCLPVSHQELFPVTRVWRRRHIDLNRTLA
jgi:hypothetical protein